MLNLSSPFLQVLDNIMKTGHKLGLRFKFTEVDLSHTDCSMRYIFIWIERLIDWLIDRILNNYISTNISLISEQFSMVLTARANQWIEKKRYFILLVSFHPACFWFALISIYLSFYLSTCYYLFTAHVLIHSNESKVQVLDLSYSQTSSRSLKNFCKAIHMRVLMLDHCMNLKRSKNKGRECINTYILYVCPITLLPPPRTNPFRFWIIAFTIAESNVFSLLLEHPIPSLEVLSLVGTSKLLSDYWINQVGMY